MGRMFLAMPHVVGGRLCARGSLAGVHLPRTEDALRPLVAQSEEALDDTPPKAPATAVPGAHAK